MFLNFGRGVHEAAETQEPREGCGPAAAAWRFKATYDLQLFFRMDAQGGGCTPGRCVRGCILTIVAYRCSTAAAAGAGFTLLVS